MTQREFPPLASSVYYRIFNTAHTTSSLPCQSVPAGGLVNAFPNYSPIILQQYPMSSMRSNTDTSTAVDYTPTLDFMWRMHQALADATKNHYLATNTQLKAMLFTQSRLLWHLKGMSEFYFMMQGEVMHAFCTSLFNKVSYTKTSDIVACVLDDLKFS